MSGKRYIDAPPSSVAGRAEAVVPMRSETVIELSMFMKGILAIRIRRVVVPVGDVASMEIRAKDAEVMKKPGGIRETRMLPGLGDRVAETVAFRRPMRGDRR
jgi:hypothetical protein